MGIIEQYFLQLKMEKRRGRRAAAILTVLSLVVAIGVSWNLRMTGITIANGATCGLEEHRHSEECAMEQILICGIETAEPMAEPVAEPVIEAAPVIVAEPVVAEAVTETEGEAVEGEAGAAPVEPPAPVEPAAPVEPVPTAEPQPQHEHTEACFEVRYLCGQEEHYHLLSCYADATADIETAVNWEAGLPQPTGNWADDLVCVAQTQLGCAESERNYIVAEDGVTRNGITRYGQWYGNPHGDWSGMFAMFCLHYAEVPADAVPRSPGVYNAMRLAQDAGIFAAPDEKMGEAGSLLFLDTDANGNADRILIVSGQNGGELAAIGGDWENAVANVALAANDTRIMGYINLRQRQIDLTEPVNTEEAEAELPEEEEPSEEEELPEEEALPEESDEPGITLNVEFAEEEGLIRIHAELVNLDAEEYLWQWQYSEDGNEPWLDLEGATELVCEVENTEENLHRFYRLQGELITAQSRSSSTFAINRVTTVVQSGDRTVTSDSVTPFNIDKNGNNNSTSFTIDVYALPVDAEGNRITGFDVTELDSVRVSGSTPIEVTSLHDESLGLYHSAYFGSLNSVSVNNVESVWRNTSGRYYYLAYRQTNGTENTTWLRNDSTSSLYLRYMPLYTVRFESEGGFETLSESVVHQSYPSLTAPGSWTREGYMLLGWTVNGNEQNVYTYEEIMGLPVTADVTYRAKWMEKLSIRFDLGEYVNALEPIAPILVLPGESISPLPVPAWKNNEAAMAFDGWYLDVGLTQPVGEDHKFDDHTILYAKWSPIDEGYYVYFMDFARQDQPQLVLATYTVTVGKSVAPHTPGNAPSGKEWDGKWYLDSGCKTVYNFAIPVSEMTDYLGGAGGRDLNLYPGMQDVCRAIFVTYGTRVDPVTVPIGGTVDLNDYIPEREGFVFAGWTLADGTPVSGAQTLNETTTFYATWEAGYVPFEAILRIENANDFGMTQAEILGTWYAKAGSRIVVKSAYSGSGDNRKGTHTVVCVIDGEEFPVYTNESRSEQAVLSDVYSKFFLYNNTGTTWTDEVNWDDVYTGGEVPYSTRPISSAGDTIINFDYMRVRTDVKFRIANDKAYLDVYKLYQDGLITGSVTYSGTKPTTTGKNVSASGVSATNISWTYTVASGSNTYNVYTLKNVKYGQRIYEDYPVGGSWLSVKDDKYSTWVCNTTNFTSRREDLSDAFFKGSGRSAVSYDLTAQFNDNTQTALMYAIECLPGETADFTINNVGYKVQTHLSEVVNSSGTFSAKELMGCEEGVNARGSGYYSNLSTGRDTVGGVSVRSLFGTTFWEYYDKYTGIDSLDDIERAYIFYYNRLHISINFSFAYDVDGDSVNESVKYEDIAFGQPIAEYQLAKPDFERHQLLNREGYEFVGWLDANGFVLTDEDWDSLVADGDSDKGSMIFIAKWEKISNNIVEYYEDRSAAESFESHYFDEGELLQYPTMAVYPQGWVWQEKGEGAFDRFDWQVPMYGEYGVEEQRTINGEERTVSVIRIYGTWDDSHTKVVYDPNGPQGGIPGSAPTDPNEYTIWQAKVSVAARGDTANTDPAKAFAGWRLDRNGIVYQPGDHVTVQWPRTMIFTAQWVDAEEVVYLRYDPNGGAPADIYPNENGFPYGPGANAFVWDNSASDGTVWYTRDGYGFIGWNTAADGSGAAYAPGSIITLTEPETTLYAQWEKKHYTLSLYKVDAERQTPLTGAEFGLYKLENGKYLSVQSGITGVDGHITFQNMENDTYYKLVEETPPNGYAILAGEIFFRVQPNGNVSSLVFYDADGNVIGAPKGVSGEYITGTQLLTLTVQNMRGYVLPSTGGIGVPLYLLCGLTLMSAPFVYILRCKRKREGRTRE